LEPKSSKFASISILDASYDPSSTSNWEIKSMSSSSSPEMVVVGCVALMDIIATSFCGLYFINFAYKKKGYKDYTYITK
jgi:hypothetical protein